MDQLQAATMQAQAPPSDAALTNEMMNDGAVFVVRNDDGSSINSQGSSACFTPASSMSMAPVNGPVAHSPLPRRQRDICRHWARGYCNRGAMCGFFHTGPSPNPELCKKASPPYSADEMYLIVKNTVPCKDFSVGKCSRGEKCKFSHGEIDPRLSNVIPQGPTMGMPPKDVYSDGYYQAYPPPPPAAPMHGQMMYHQEPPAVHSEVPQEHYNYQQGYHQQGYGYADGYQYPMQHESNTIPQATAPPAPTTYHAHARVPSPTRPRVMTHCPYG